MNPTVSRDSSEAKRVKSFSECWDTIEEIMDLRAGAMVTKFDVRDCTHASLYKSLKQTKYGKHNPTVLLSNQSKAVLDELRASLSESTKRAR